VLLSVLVFTKVTNAVFLGEPAPLGFGFSQYAIAGLYGTPIVRELTETFPCPFNSWLGIRCPFYSERLSDVTQTTGS